MIGTVVVLAKAPVAGRVKTRLTPPLTPQAAANVAAAALADTLDTISMIPAQRRVLAFDGDAAPWRPRGWDMIAQPTGGLDVRIAAALADAGNGSVVLVGMDTPQLRADQLTAFDPEQFGACLAPSEDGGYWAIGLRDPRDAHAVVSGVPMSTRHTGAMQLMRLRQVGLRVQLLDRLADVDTIGTARHVAAVVPESRFARALADVDDGYPVSDARIAG